MNTLKIFFAAWVCVILILAGLFLWQSKHVSSEVVSFPLKPMLSETALENPNVPFNAYEDALRQELVKAPVLTELVRGIATATLEARRFCETLEKQGPMQ